MPGAISSLGALKVSQPRPCPTVSHREAEVVRQAAQAFVRSRPLGVLERDQISLIKGDDLMLDDGW